MRTRKLFATAATGALLVAMGVVPAGAVEGETTTTFEVTSSGGLAISVPTNEGLGTLDAATLDLSLGGSLTGSFTNAITVTDTRGLLTATWTTDVYTKDANTDTVADPFILTALQTGDTGTIDPTQSNQKVDASAVTYAPDGDGTSTIVENLVSSGAVVTPVTGDLTGDAVTGASVSYTGVGNNEVAWTPYLTVELAPDQVAGTYEGVIVHSVS